MQLHEPPSIEVLDELRRPDWLPPETWPFVLRRFELGRPRSGRDEPITIHYTDVGSGPVLVFVHVGLWSFVWRDVIARLVDGFRCVSLDFPGSGLSGGSPEDVTLARHADALTALLDHLQVDKACFVVHDLGGVAGLRSAIDRPDRLRGLVATNTFAWRPEGRALRTMLAVMGSRPAIHTLGTMRFVPRMSRTRFGVGRRYDRGDRRAYFGPFRRRVHARNFHRAMRSADRSPELFDEVESRLGRFTDRPVLTVFGEKNDPFGFAHRWRATFPNTTSWVVPGGNHFPMCDDPEGYAAELRRWHRAEVEPV